MDVTHFKGSAGYPSIEVDLHTVYPISANTGSLLKKFFAVAVVAKDALIYERQNNGMNINDSCKQ